MRNLFLQASYQCIGTVALCKINKLQLHKQTQNKIKLLLTFISVSLWAGKYHLNESNERIYNPTTSTQKWAR